MERELLPSYQKCGAGLGICFPVIVYPQCCWPLLKHHTQILLLFKSGFTFNAVRELTIFGFGFTFYHCQLVIELYTSVPMDNIGTVGIRTIKRDFLRTFQLKHYFRLEKTWTSN